MKVFTDCIGGFQYHTLQSPEVVTARKTFSRLILTS